MSEFEVFYQESYAKFYRFLLENCYNEREELWAFQMCRIDDPGCPDLQERRDNDEKQKKMVGGSHGGGDDAGVARSGTGCR